MSYLGKSWILIRKVTLKSVWHLKKLFNKGKRKEYILISKYLLTSWVRSFLVLMSGLVTRVGVFHSLTSLYLPPLHRIVFFEKNDGVIYDNHVISLTEFSSNINPKWPVIVAFLSSSGLKNTFDAFSEWNTSVFNSIFRRSLDAAIVF